MITNTLAFAACIALASCASKMLKIETNEKAQVFVADSPKAGGSSKKIGETPFSSKLSDLAGKLVKISAPGKQMTYLVVPKLSGTTNNVFLDLPGNIQDTTCEKVDNVKEAKTKNMQLRLIMTAYKELSLGNNSAVIDLATKAEMADPAVAAPHIVKAMALIKMGDKELAKSSLIKAKNLDPDDKDIQKLIDSME